MSENFQIEVQWAQALKVDTEKERAVRLYCSQSATTWELQVRAPMRLRTGLDGKDLIVATASMGIDDLKALRAAIDIHLAEAKKTNGKSKTARADARLVAAAPDLLEALKAFLEDGLKNGYDETHQEVRDARAAIVKAGGKS